MYRCHMCDIDFYYVSVRSTRTHRLSGFTEALYNWVHQKRLRGHTQDASLCSKTASKKTKWNRMQVVSRHC